MSFVSTAVILYSCPPVSPKLIISPTLNPVPDVNVIVVSPTDIESLVVVLFTSSYVVAMGMCELDKLFSQVNVLVIPLAESPNHR